MGIGDQLIATGLARDAWTKRGKKIAFGDGIRIIWDKHSQLIFQNNPNIAFPGHKASIEWVAFHKGQRGYNRQGAGHWIWNMDWRCKPGEIYLTHGEEAAGKHHGSGFVVIEPNVVPWKSSAQNKRWSFDRYQEVADRLIDGGNKVVQFVNPDGEPMLDRVTKIKAQTFREAVSILKRSTVYVGAEGGMHHAAAAVGIPGVVIFGGFIPPSVTGYDMHTNIAGSDKFCGSFKPCQHCANAMDQITVDIVFGAVKERLLGR